MSYLSEVRQRLIDIKKVPSNTVKTVKAINDLDPKLTVVGKSYTVDTIPPDYVELMDGEVWHAAYKRKAAGDSGRAAKRANPTPDRGSRSSKKAKG